MRKVNCKLSIVNCSGFTLLEALMSLAIFAIIALGVIGSYAALTKSVKVVREKTILAALADNYMEIVKNMPYSQVGTKVGNPNGPLADLTNAITTKIESYSYKIYYEVTFIDDPADGIAPADVEPADYKQVKMTILNTTNNQASIFSTNIVPKGLEGTLNAGALLIKVFNANGQPLAGASIHIESTTTAPSIILDRTSDASGQWIEVGLPAKVNGYHIVVTKAGYSTDMTYPPSVSNPNPIKPDATILDGQVTTVSFSIDVLSTLNIKTLNTLCQNLNGVNMNVRGAKLVGTSPDVLKFYENFSSSAGVVALNSLEWDSYTPVLLTGQSWVVAGTSPIQKIDVLPNTTQTFSTILGLNSTANSLLLVVKDAATGAALENVYAHLQEIGPPTEDYYGYTSGSVWTQSDWSSGSGLTNWSTSTPNQYFQDDANIDVISVPVGVRLKQNAGLFVSSGWLESSTFDTGTGLSNFTTLSWDPPSQSSSTLLSFQLAANNDNLTWNYVGPDGTSATYYTVPGSNVGSVLDNNRYIRYKAYLSSVDPSITPVFTSVNINYISGCFTPGQVWFGDLNSADHFLEVSIPGYQTQTINSLNINGNQSLEILMSP